jgi:hypothetical protein
MKLLSCLLLLATSADAFLVRSPGRVATEVKVASNPGEWNKPLTGRVSTVPVPVNQVSKAERAKMEDRIIDPDFTLALGTFLLAPLIMWYHPTYMADGSLSLIGVFGAGFHVVFAALLWVQTVRVRLVFEKDAMEFYNVVGPQCDLEKGAKLVRKPSNYVAGTQNRWKYDDIINYGFFPSLEFPVICYMKETATDEYKWNRWFAAFDSYGRGQPHFFPGICNAKQVKEEFEKRGIKRKPIKMVTGEISKK